MIRVRSVQLDAIEQSMAIESFEDDMVAHVAGFVPRLSGTLGELGVRAFIRFGVERARAHDVTDPGLVEFYLDMMLMFGSLFDVDPLLPWARSILGDASLGDEEGRMSRLHDAMRAYLAAVAGPFRLRSRTRKFAVAALRRLAAARFEDFPVEEHRADARKVIDSLRAFHPERCAYVGEPALEALVARGPETAARLGLATDRGVLLVTGLSFALGHGFAEDPVIPWVAAALREPVEGAAGRVAVLEARARAYLDSVMAHAERAHA